MREIEFLLTMIYTADTVFDSLEPGELATPVEQDDIPTIRDTMACVPLENVTDMSPCAKNMNPKTGRNTGFTGNP